MQSASQALYQGLTRSTALRVSALGFDASQSPQLQPGRKRRHTNLGAATPAPRRRCSPYSFVDSAAPFGFAQGRLKPKAVPLRTSEPAETAALKRRTTRNAEGAQKHKSPELWVPGLRRLILLENLNAYRI